MITNLNEALLNVGKGKTNRIGNVNKNHVYDPFVGGNKTIKEFYDEFVNVREPDEKVIRDWHKMLNDYFDMPGAVFPIRAGNVKKSLRRGWLTKTNQGFAFLFTDNDLATYIYKMALDGFCPTVDEFYNAMTTFKKANDIRWISNKKTIYNNIDKNNKTERMFLDFPVHFLRSGGKSYPDKYENEMNSYIINGPVCCLGRMSYKHSHIFDAGNYYLVNGEIHNLSSLCKAYFSLGDVDDYKWDSSVSNYVRHISLDKQSSEEIRKILKAVSLRFIDPINHFLSPKAKYNRFTTSKGEENEDIAEYPALIDFIKERRKDVFKEIFEQYKKDVLCMPYSSNSGDEEINIIYSSKSKQYKTLKKQSSTKKSASNSVQYRGNNYSKRTFVITALNDFIKERNIKSLKEFNNLFPAIAKLSSEVKDKKRYSSEIELPSGERICISNQIGDKPGFPKSRNYSSIKERLVELGFNI